MPQVRMTDRLRYRYGYAFLYPPALKRAQEHSIHMRCSKVRSQEGLRLDWTETTKDWTVCPVFSILEMIDQTKTV